MTLFAQVLNRALSGGGGCRPTPAGSVVDCAALVEVADGGLHGRDGRVPAHHRCGGGCQQGTGAGAGAGVRGDRRADGAVAGRGGVVWPMPLSETATGLCRAGGSQARTLIGLVLTRVGEPDAAVV